MGTAGAAAPTQTRAERGGRLLRLAFALGLAWLLWSFVGGLVYLLALERALPLRTDPLAGARDRAAKGDVEGALRQYRTAARIDASDLRAAAEMGELLLKHGRLAEAEAAFAGALRVSPADPRALTGLGDVRLSQQRWDEAVAVYESLPAAAPRSANLLNNLGIAHARAGRFDQAIAAFEQAVALGAEGRFRANLTLARADRERARAARP